MDQLMQALMPKAEAIKAYASQYGFYIKICVVIQSRNRENNGAMLSQDFIRFLNAIGAEFEVDVYDYN